MRPQLRSIHNRSYSVSNCNDYDYPSQYQKRMYYEYIPKNQDLKNQYKDMPSFGQKFQYRKNQQSYEKSRDNIKENQYENEYRNIRQRNKYSLDHQVDQNKYYRINENEFRNRMKTEENWYSRNPSRDYEKYETKLSNSRGSRIEFSRATEQKLMNIDKINSKIRKILDTLTEQEKKISQNHHLKIGTKKIALHSHSYANRIKTEGDDDSNENYRRKYEQKNVPASTLYDRLVGIRDKYQSNKNVLGQININNRQWDKREKRTSNYETQYQKKPYIAYQNQKYRIPQTTQGFYVKKQPLNIQKPQNNQHNRHYTETQNIKFIPQTPYKLLKGTNVKSTDSLNISSSINLRNQKEKLKDYKEQNSNMPQNNKYLPSDIKNNKQVSNYIPINSEYSQQKFYEDRRKEYENKNRLIVDYSQSKKHQKLKTQPILYKSIPKYQQKQQLPSFSSFGQSRTRYIENTPIRNIPSRSLTKYEASQKSYKLNNGKDLDAQIEKIQRKINDFETIKKQLGVEEGEKMKHSKDILNRSLSKYRQTKSLVSPKQYQSPVKNTKNQDKDTPFIALKNSSSQIDQYSTYSNHNLTLNLPEPEIGSSKVNQDEANYSNNFEISLPKPFKMSSRKNTRRMNNSNVKEIQSTFISEERFLLQNTSIRSLISNLCKQIQLDTNLRTSKKWFHRKDNPYKWAELSKELARRNIKTTQQQNREIFTMGEEEENPFHTIRDDQGSCSEMVQNFLASQQFWIENLQHKYIRSQIENNLRQMDIDRRGSIKIQDMVRYVNLQSDKYFRNRDLSLVFRRLSGTKGEVTVQYILAEFCQF